MRIVLFSFMALITLPLYAQKPNNPSNLMELGSFEYGLVPDVGETQIENYSIRMGFGLPIGKGMIGANIRYNNYHFHINKNDAQIDLSDFEKMHALGVSLLYVRPLSSTWSLILNTGPSLMSNLVGGISSEDIIISGRLVATKRWGNHEKNAVLTFGVAYGTLFGEPNIFPVISFRKRINAQWSYSLGLPFTGVSYQINERNRIMLTASPDSYFGNNSSEITLNNLEVISASKIQYLGIKTGLEHRYRIQPNITIVTKAGFVPITDLQIQTRDNDLLYEFETDGSPYISMGLSFNLDKKSNTNKNINETDEN